MTSFRCKISFLGVMVFAISFFLPLEFYNSPLARFRWSLDSVFLAETWGESLVFIGICLAIIYPYLWALVTSLFFLSSFHGRWAVPSQFICHLSGGIPIASLGVTLLLIKAEFPPVLVQWIAALAPVLLFLLLAISLRLKSSARFPVMASLSLIIFLPLQFVLYHQVSLDGGVGWGFFLGGVGALIGLIGSISLIFRS